MDIALLSLESASLFLLETILKGFIYSVKLKLEFVILGRLVNFVRGDRPSQSSPSKPVTQNGPRKKSLRAHSEELEDISEFVDLNKLEHDPTHTSTSAGSLQSRQHADSEHLEEGYGDVIRSLSVSYRSDGVVNGNVV